MGRCQPMWTSPFAPVAAKLASFGPVASYLKSNAVSRAFPAASRQLPASVAAAESGPLYSIGAVQDAMPEVESVPVKLTLSGPRYQPFASGSRSTFAAIAGSVESNLSVAPTGALVFPALSVQVALTDAAALSGPEYEGVVHEATPETGSVPDALIATVRLYQPPASGSRAGAAVTAGGVESYFSVTARGALTLPATSVQAPLTWRDAPSGPAYCGLAHEAMPDTASEPVKATSTAWLYQPFESGARVGLPPATEGADLSILGVAVAEFEPEANVTVQVCELCPSAVTSWAASQPELEITFSISVIVQRMVTLLRNHPFEPAVPVIVKLTVGAGDATGASASASVKTTTLTRS